MYDQNSVVGLVGRVFGIHDCWVLFSVVFTCHCFLNGTRKWNSSEIDEEEPPIFGETRKFGCLETKFVNLSWSKRDTRLACIMYNHEIMKDGFSCLLKDKY